MPDSRRYYFRIPSVNVFQCVNAGSLAEAKTLVAEEWASFQGELEWVNVETVTESVIYD